MLTKWSSQLFIHIFPLHLSLICTFTFLLIPFLSHPLTSLPNFSLSSSHSYLEASSNDSCHCSCHKMATLISSSDTMTACWTNALLCSLRLLSTISAASLLTLLWLLDATVRGYINAWRKKDVTYIKMISCWYNFNWGEPQQAPQLSDS